jgi:DNA-binding transcriptional LysR family regulator
MFESHGLKPNVVLDATTAPNVCELVAAGFGVTLVHPLFADSVRGRVVIRRFEPSMPFHFLLCRPRGARNSKLVNAFIEEARKAAKESSLQLASSA